MIRELFFLCYGSDGAFTYDAEDFTPSERAYLFELIKEQKERENKAIEAANKN